MHMRMVRLYDAAPRRSAPVRLPAAVAPREQRAPAQKPSWLLTQGSRQPCGLGAAAWLCCSATVEAAGSTQPELTPSAAAQGPHRVALRLARPRRAFLHRSSRGGSRSDFSATVIVETA